MSRRIDFTRHYSVKPGDTLWKIARENKTTVDTLLRFNPGIDLYNLQAGRLICLPPVAPVRQNSACASGIYWTVAPGETFWAVSQATGVPLDTLLALNPFVDPENMPVGTNLCLPS
ncbi:MAG: LysM peptidoglycan-binding domain-containing protein [Bacillota bacterium]